MRKYFRAAEDLHARRFRKPTPEEREREREVTVRLYTPKKYLLSRATIESPAIGKHFHKQYRPSRESTLKRKKNDGGLYILLPGRRRRIFRKGQQWQKMTFLKKSPPIYQKFPNIVSFPLASPPHPGVGERGERLHFLFFPTTHRGEEIFSLIHHYPKQWCHFGWERYGIDTISHRVSPISLNCSANSLIRIRQIRIREGRGAERWGELPERENVKGFSAGNLTIRLFESGETESINRFQ